MIRKILSVLFFAMSLFAENSYAQQEPQWNIGFRAAGLLGVNEAVHQSVKPQFHLYGLWLNGISPNWSIEAGIGFIGNLSSVNQGGFSEYSTDILPIDLRIRYSPLERPDWQPYIYAGIGILHYGVSSKPSNISSDANLEGTSFFLPLGIGLRHPLDDNWAVEASIGENPTFSDDLNPVHDDRNDAFWGFTIGVTYSFGAGKDPSRIGGDEFDFGSRGNSQVFGSIVFDSAKARLRPEFDPLLTPVLNALLNHPEIEIQIRAYTDNSGDLNEATALTENRAESIKVWLVSRGISASRISTQGYGPHNPIVPNDTQENMRKNQRIEIVRMK